LRGIRNRLGGEKFLDYLRGEVKLRGINNTLRLFTEEELQLLHEATLQILEDPGMRIAEMGFLEVLDGKGWTSLHYREYAYKWGNISCYVSR